MAARFPKRLLLVLAVGLVLPAAAQAHRAPTGRERAGITHAARLGTRGQPVRVKVRDVKVSTVGPWATATIDVYFKGRARPDTDGLAFVKAHGKWFEAGADGVRNLTPSKAVAKDLGLYVTPPDSSFPQPAAPGTSGKSDTLDIVVGAVIVLLILIGLGYLGGRGGGDNVRSSGPSSPSTAHKEVYQYKPAPRQCSICAGTGKRSCYTCGGYRSYRDNATGQMVNCNACDGNGKIASPCSNCRGTGHLS